MEEDVVGADGGQESIWSKGYVGVEVRHREEPSQWGERSVKFSIKGANLIN